MGTNGERGKKATEHVYHVAGTSSPTDKVSILDIATSEMDAQAIALARGLLAHSLL